MTQDWHDLLRAVLKEANERYLADSLIKFSGHEILKKERGEHNSCCKKHKNIFTSCCSSSNQIVKQSDSWVNSTKKCREHQFGEITLFEKNLKIKIWWSYRHLTNELRSFRETVSPSFNWRNPWLKVWCITCFLDLSTDTVVWLWTTPWGLRPQVRTGDISGV
jgi:hypothetical protein